MNLYLPRFVAGIEETRRTLSTLLDIPEPGVTFSPVLGPRRDMPLAPPEPVDGVTFSSDDVLEGRHFVDGHWTGLEHRIEQGPCTDTRWRGLVLERCSKWASRCYRMGPGNRITACAFVNVAPEHAIYWNLRGGDSASEALTIRTSLFVDIASQAVQLVYRPQEQGFDFERAGDGLPGGPVTVVDCLVRNAGSAIGDGNARAAFALSFFTSPHRAVRVVRTIVDKSMQERSTGALLVQAFPSAWIQGSAFMVGEATQPPLKFEGTRQVRLETVAVFARSGQGWVDFSGCEGAVIRGCRGNVRVHWNGVDVGPIENVHVLGHVA